MHKIIITQPSKTEQFLTTREKLDTQILTAENSSLSAQTTNNLKERIQENLMKEKTVLPEIQKSNFKILEKRRSHSKLIGRSRQSEIKGNQSVRIIRVNRRIGSKKITKFKNITRRQKNKPLWNSSQNVPKFLSLHTVSFYKRSNPKQQKNSRRSKSNQNIKKKESRRSIMKDSMHKRVSMILKHDVRKAPPPVKIPNTLMQLLRSVKTQYRRTKMDFLFTSLQQTTDRRIQKLDKIESKKIKLDADLYLRPSAINFFKSKNEKILNPTQILKLQKDESGEVAVMDRETQYFYVFSKIPRYLVIKSKDRQFPFYFKIRKLKGGYTDFKVYISRTHKKPNQRHFDYEFSQTEVDMSSSRREKVLFSNCFDNTCTYMAIETSEPYYLLSIDVEFTENQSKINTLENICTQALRDLQRIPFYQETHDIPNIQEQVDTLFALEMPTPKSVKSPKVNKLDPNYRDFNEINCMISDNFSEYRQKRRIFQV